MRTDWIICSRGICAAAALVSLVAPSPGVIPFEIPEIEIRAEYGAEEVAEVAGYLPVDLHSELLVATAGGERALNWYNLGRYWGSFGEFGFDGPREQYPLLVSESGVDIVRFEGGQLMRLDMPAESDLSDDFTIEAWVCNPSFEEREVVVSWGDPEQGDVVEFGVGRALGTGVARFGETKGISFRRAPAADVWQHYVLVYDGSSVSLHVNGEIQVAREMKLSIAPGSRLRLGCGVAEDSFFSGDLAALRIHDKPMSAGQIRRNRQGGVKLGTKLLPNTLAAGTDKGKGSLYLNDHQQAGVQVFFSEHWRNLWSVEQDRKRIQEMKGRFEMEKMYERQTQEYEYYWDKYAKDLGMPLPVVAARKELRGDGRHYLTDVGNSFSGGSFMGWNGQLGFGFPITGAGFSHGHELAHVVQGHSMGALHGPFWESHANWLPEQTGIFHVVTAHLTSVTAPLFPSVGRNYYHDFLILNHLAESEEYGPLFIARMWHHGKKKEGDIEPPWAFEVFRQVDPDPDTSIGYEFARMAQKTVTWDFDKREQYLKQMAEPRGQDELRQRRAVLLEPVPWRDGWHRVPRGMAPMQLGWNLVELEPCSGELTCTIEGMADPSRDVAWRFGFVAVGADGRPVYSDIYTGDGEFSVPAGAESLHMVVVAEPGDLVYIDHSMDSRAVAGERFPYMVKLGGAKPAARLAPAEPEAQGGEHPNGGGFVAGSASVAESAWVGPEARVLGAAKVEGEARIEDRAVVKGNAVVRDRARVSGDALVSDGAVVSGDARVGDFALVTAPVGDAARVWEHAHANAAIGDHATAKGLANVLGTLRGSSLVDGFYTKTQTIDRGVWMTWSWGSGQNAAELDIDLGGLYAQYRFEGEHPVFAEDSFGITHATVIGGAERVTDESRLVMFDSDRWSAAIEDSNSRVARPDGRSPVERYCKPDAHALSLGGDAEFVEIPKDAVWMRDWSLDMEVLWVGGECEGLFSFGRDEKNLAVLTPSDAEGKLAFHIMVNGARQSVAAAGPLPKDEWHRVQLVLSGDSGRLYVDGREVGFNPLMTHNPEDVRATACYLGRGFVGNGFRGMVDEVSIYSTAILGEEPGSTSGR